jgi:hypothetical protein
MLTIKKLDGLMLEQQADYTKSSKSRIDYLAECRLQIRAGITEADMQGQLERVKAKLEALDTDERYSEWAGNNQAAVLTSKNPLTVFRTEVGIKKLRAQARHLSFMLELD